MRFENMCSELKFAQSFGKAAFRNGSSPDFFLTRLLQSLPCQIEQSENEPCLGFRIEPNGARPCGCALLKGQLSPMTQCGWWESIFHLASFDKIQHSPMPKLAFVCTENPESRRLMLFRFLLAFAYARSLLEDTFPAPTNNSTDLQSLSIRVLEKLFTVQGLFLSDYHASFLWSHIETAFGSYKAEGFETLQTLYKGRQLVLLDFEQNTLAPNAPDVRAFEFFVSEISQTKAGLIVFSSQKLLQSREQSGGYDINFERPMRRSYRDNTGKWRIESSKASHKPHSAFQDVVSAGSWDRLLELLARGQKILDSILQSSV
jgi:hypothetical protein